MPRGQSFSQIAVFVTSLSPFGSQATGRKETSSLALGALETSHAAFQPLLATSTIASSTHKHDTLASYQQLRLYEGPVAPDHSLCLRLDFKTISQAKIIGLSLRSGYHVDFQHESCFLQTANRNRATKPFGRKPPLERSRNLKRLSFDPFRCANASSKLE